MSLRRIVSLTLMLSIAGMLTTSIMLYIVPQGRVANWAGWSLWGLDKSQWGALHTNLGLLMLIAGGFHLYYNWRPITSYLKNKKRELRMFTPNFNMALGVFTVFCVLTLTAVPPLAWIQDLRDWFENEGAAELGQPPYGHAEESSLRVFIRNTGLDQAAVLANLSAAGIEVTDTEIVVLELAQEHGMMPQELYEIMLGPQDQRSTDTVPFPDSMPQGSGRLSLVDFCAKFNQDVDRAEEILTAAGMTVDRTQSLKDIAAENGVEPLDLLDLLRGGTAK